MEIDYSWWGWVDVSHDMMPRVCQPDPRQSVYYALGYGGNGVSYSQQAGRRLAEQIAGKGARQTLPIFTSPLPGHRSRRSGASGNGCSTCLTSGTTKSPERSAYRPA